MAKQIRQSPGVAGGTIDIPYRTGEESRTVGVAGEALSRRKHAGVRARKLSARRAQRRTQRRSR